MSLVSNTLWTQSGFNALWIDYIIFWGRQLVMKLKLILFQHHIQLGHQNKIVVVLNEPACKVKHTH